MGEECNFEIYSFISIATILSYLVLSQVFKSPLWNKRFDEAGSADLKKEILLYFYEVYTTVCLYIYY